MEGKIINTILIAAGIIIAAVIIAAGLGNIPAANISSAGEAQRNTVSVTGEANLDVAPDKAEIYLSIVTRGTDANEAQDENSRISEEVISALRAVGINKNGIETDWFNIYPEYDWDEGYSKVIGYRAEHTLKITTTDLERVGVVLDAAVNAGANQVQSVNFGLTRDKEQEIYGDALEIASGLAKEKADSIASALGVRLGKIISVSESSSGYTPYRYYDYAAAESKAGGVAPVPVQPEEVTVNGYVSLVYEIE